MPFIPLFSPRALNPNDRDSSVLLRATRLGAAPVERVPALRRVSFLSLVQRAGPPFNAL